MHATRPALTLPSGHSFLLRGEKISSPVSFATRQYHYLAYRYLHVQFNHTCYPTRSMPRFSQNHTCYPVDKPQHTTIQRQSRSHLGLPSSPGLPAERQAPPCSGARPLPCSGEARGIPGSHRGWRCPGGPSRHGHAISMDAHLRGPSRTPANGGPSERIRVTPTPGTPRLHRPGIHPGESCPLHVWSRPRAQAYPAAIAGQTPGS